MSLIPEEIKCKPAKRGSSSKLQKSSQDEKPYSLINTRNFFQYSKQTFSGSMREFFEAADAVANVKRRGAKDTKGNSRLNKANEALDAMISKVHAPFSNQDVTELVFEGAVGGSNDEAGPRSGPLASISDLKRKYTPDQSIEPSQPRYFAEANSNDRDMKQVTHDDCEYKKRRKVRKDS